MSTTDLLIVGERRYVYCRQHMRPHQTGWCCVVMSEKVKLDAITLESALVECQVKGFPVYKPEWR